MNAPRTPAARSRYLLWALAAAATAGALAAAVVAWRSAAGQEQARAAEVLVIAACTGVGALILTARPGQPVGRALLAGGAAWGLASLPVELLVASLRARPDDELAAAALVVAFVVRGLGWLVLVVVLPLVFPDGATGRSRWWLRVALAELGLFGAAILAQPVVHDERVPGARNPLGLPASWQLPADAFVLVVFAVGLGCLVAGLVAVAARWRNGSALVRQQVGWFALGLGITVAAALVLGSGLVGAPAYSVAVAALPVAVGVAVLQHRLYEVDLLVNRACCTGC